MATKKGTRTALFRERVPADDVVVWGSRLGDALSARLSVFFAEYGLTVLQYNVLRILYVRDPDGEGLSTGAIGERLPVRGPDVTRLIDRLASAGLVERFRSAEDRRIVKVRLTGSGAARVEDVHPPLVRHNQELFSQIPRRELERLANLLERAFKAVF